MKDGSLIKFSYPDNLTPSGKHLNGDERKYERSKKVLGEKDLKVNVEMTKGMKLSYCKKTYVSKVNPCESELYLVCKISKVDSLLLFRCASTSGYLCLLNVSSS